MAPKRVVVVDHYDSYTYNLVHLVASVTGELPEVHQHDQVSVADLAAFSHVILSPGPGHPDDPRDFAVGRALLTAAHQPVFGVCLGMQGLVAAYGGHIGRLRPAHGEVAEVQHDGHGVFAGVPSPLQAVRYHSLGVVGALPECLQVTATCQGPADPQPVVMGVRHRELPLEGVQFHPESILSEHGAALIANFLGVPHG